MNERNDILPTAMVLQQKQVITFKLSFHFIIHKHLAVVPVIYGFILTGNT